MAAKRKAGSIPIKCIETGRVYQSTKDAADDIGCAPPLVSAHLKGKLKHAKHFHFEYVKPDFKILADETAEVRDVVGYEGLFKVSRTGVVYNARTGFEVMQNPQNGGYLMVNIRGKGKPRLITVHRIVAMAFLDNPENLPCVNHKDENKQNNNADNLEWCTAKYNINYGTARKRMIEKRGFKVQCIETGELFQSVRNAAIAYNTQPYCIRFQIAGKYKTAGGMHWRYFDKEV